MDVKKLMVSFCIEDSFFSKGKKRGRHVPPLSSNNAFCVKKRKNDIHVAWEEYYNAQSPSSSSSSASNKKTPSFLSFAMMRRPFCWTSSSRSRWAFFFLPFVVAILFWRWWWFGREEVTSATTTFEASESAARRVPLPAHNEDDEGCTLRRLVARGGILVHKWYASLFCEEKTTQKRF